MDKSDIGYLISWKTMVVVSWSVIRFVPRKSRNEIGGVWIEMILDINIVG